MSAFAKELLRAPPVVGVVTGVALAAFGAWFTGGVVVLASVLWARRRAGTIKYRLMASLQGTAAAVDPALAAQLDELPELLGNARLLSGVEQLAGQAYEQIGNLVDSYLAYRKVLGQKFSTGEMTYGRYLGAGQQVYLGGLDNLNRIGTHLQALAAMDFESMRNRKRRLERQETLDEAGERELSALNDRFAEYEAQNAQIRQWLAATEEALTQIAAATSTLATVRTQQGLAELERETAMMQLEELSSRVSIYSLDKVREER